jgi:hypothetical protein
VTDWQRFKIVGSPSELTTVRHITHVPTARRIIEDGRIRAGLIYDESRLNQSRLSVVWVSANSWFLGSIYGTVELQFDWSAIAAERLIYWIESIDHYKPPAYRFLLTRRFAPDPSLAQPYDPTVHDGPLKLANGNWYWNSTYTSEFMIDEDLLLENCIGLNFVEHHPTICTVDGSNCSELTTLTRETGGRILAFLLGHELHVLDTHLRPEHAQPSQRIMFDLLDTAVLGLDQRLQLFTRFNGQAGLPRTCRQIVQGAMALYGMDRTKQARELLALIASSAHYNQALTEIIREHFGVTDWQMQP